MQLTLALAEGFHIGPLFIPIKRKLRVAYGTVMPGRLRRSIERRATPKWADAAEINLAYRVATQMTIDTGIVHSVDHIVPLKHPLVCGLHCPANLRVITLEENLRKSNNHWPDMPGEQMVLL